MVSLEWTMADGQGQVLDELEEPVEFFYGGEDLLPKVEQVLADQEPGFEALLKLEPEDAFGDYRAELVCFEDRDLFPEGIAEGMQFEGLPEGARTVGMPAGLIYTITELYPEHVVLDANHPLAGMALQLKLKVIAVREATDAEKEAGSVSDDGPVSLLSAAPPSPHLH